MKRLAALALLVAVAAAGCGADDAPGQIDSDSLYEMFVEASFDTVDYLEARALSRDVCRRLDEGYDPARLPGDLLDAADRLNADPTEVGRAVGAGLSAYCPEHADAVARR